MTRAIFGGLIAVFLLALYAYAVIIAITTAWCISMGCPHGYNKELNEGIISVLDLVGGLAAALVVAELAVTQPGQRPAARILAIQFPDATSDPQVDCRGILAGLGFVRRRRSPRRLPLVSECRPSPNSGS